MTAPDAPDLLEALRRSFETRIAEANARDAARRGQAENETEGDGLPRDLARWIIDAGWRKPGADDAATVLAGLRQEMEQFEEGLKQGAWATGKPAGLSWATGVRYAIALVEAAQQRLVQNGEQL